MFEICGGGDVTRIDEVKNKRFLEGIFFVQRMKLDKEYLVEVGDDFSELARYMIDR